MKKRNYDKFLARRSAVQAIYQQISHPIDDFLEDVSSSDHILSETECDKDLFMQIANRAKENFDFFEKLIRFYIPENFEFDRIKRCVKAVLICGVSEILEKKIPIAVIINEYIELAKLFCEEEYAFIHKILNFVSDDFIRSAGIFKENGSN